MNPVRIWLSASLVLLSAAVTLQVHGAALSDGNSLLMPRAGDFQLRIIASNLVELLLVTQKDTDPAPLTTWNFIDATGNGALPATGAFSVSANGQTIPVSAVGFKRRVLYAPLRTRDLRVANWLYLRFGSGLPADAVVQVQNPGNSLWGGSINFIATNSAQRFSPAIHVNQAGYVLNFPKKAMVGYYLGTLGELFIPTNSGFQLVNAQSGAVVFTGALRRRSDVGYTYTPAPYQSVYEADFSAFNVRGEYKLVVPGLGASFPFYVDEGMAATYARTYALGIYHQRCGTDNSMPYTRFTHGPCHTSPVLIPSVPGPEQDFVNFILNQESAGAASNPRHTAPRMTNVTACLYPFVNAGLLDARGGHHDAGDYSKYTTSVAALIHHLMFAVDALPGVKELDNLGLPESGDGISDILQEAKWEADYLAKLQDADGGFYFIVYPRARQYELDVLPDHGDLQLVLPKNTSATAAAVAALAEIASSPTFKAAYPVAASNYLATAVRGWQFLQNAIAAHGRDGAYQMITFSGDVFMHDDELAWAAAALYAATGDPVYDSVLRSQVPDPNDPNLRRWSWWSMYGGYGCAFRTYAFAARTGRLAASKLDATFVARCEAEVRRAATNVIHYSDQNAYGTSFIEESKASRLAGWYFSGEWTFDPAVAYALDPRPQYLDVILKNYNYEMGCNPVNVTYLTGLGWKRQREIVHLYALNDSHVLPPNGIPLGNIQAGYDYLQLYKSELGNLSYPSDSANSGTYPYYDRWADTFNVTTEFVVSQTARSLPAAAMLMAMTPSKTDPYDLNVGRITGLPALAPVDGVLTGVLVSAGVDLAQGRVLWEGSDQEPFIGASFRFTPGNIGTNWIEAEALLPDGTRIIARTNFFALPAGDQPRPRPQPIQPEMVALYHLAGDFSDATQQQPNLTPLGSALLDPVALHVNGLGDRVQVAIPNAALHTPGRTKSITIEARLFITDLKGFSIASATLLSLSRSWDVSMSVELNKWKKIPDVKANGQVFLDGSVLTNTLTLRHWHQLSLTLDQNAYVVQVDGVEVGRKTSGDLANWSGNGAVSLSLGEFDGWIAEVVVWNRTDATGNPPPPGGNLPSALTPLTADAQGCFHFRAQSGNGTAFMVQASTDLVHWVAIYTNFFGGAIDYFDTRSLEFPRRFYRVAPLGPMQPKVTVKPGLAGTPALPAGGFRFHLDGIPGLPYRVQASTNLVNWEDLFVHAAGGPVDFVDPDSLRFPRRFYRANLLNLNPVMAAVTVPNTDRFRVQVGAGVAGPYLVEASTDFENWTPVYTSLYGVSAQLGMGTLFGAANTFYRTRPISLQPSLTVQWDAGNAAMHVEIAGVSGVPYQLETSNDQAVWTTLAANPSGGAMAYDDPALFDDPARFYRVTVPSLQPLLAVLPQTGDGFRMYTESYGAQPFALQASANLSDWSDLETNSSGGALDFSDPASLTLPHRHYRVKILPAQPDLAPPSPDPLVQLHLDGLAGVPYVVEISDDQLNWMSLATNSLGGPLEFVDTQDLNSPHFYRVNYQTTGIRGTR